MVAPVDQRDVDGCAGETIHRLQPAENRRRQSRRDGDPPSLALDGGQFGVIAIDDENGQQFCRLGVTGILADTMERARRFRKLSPALKTCTLPSSTWLRISPDNMYAVTKAERAW